nr:helix-turn-helix transcriptional regulator [Kibdelosporangium sp. MJ126-NF4]CEL22390.1 hypothetical protein [Kibdelosporangium sp. MJ126-NF4]CTQ89245.1 hypothetical protein [Kibdelosporangium sp. MJ126-NF4]
MTTRRVTCGYTSTSDNVDARHNRSRDLARTSLALPFNGRRLRHWRELAGLTQQQLADACGLSRYQISRWETGESKPGPGSLKSLVAGLADVLADAQQPTRFGLVELLDSQSTSR